MRRESDSRGLPSGTTIVVVTAVALPWAIGGVDLWASRLAAAFVAAGSALALWRGGFSGIGLDRRSRWLWPAAGLLLLAGFQWLPLPASAVRALSPRAMEAWSGAVAAPDGEGGARAVAELEARALERVPEASREPVPAADPSTTVALDPGRPVRPRLSYHPAATSERVAWFLALLLAFLVVRHGTEDPRTRRATRRVLLAGFVALAAFALAQRILDPGRIYGVIEPLRGGSPFGPYVNPSHFAFLMEMAGPWFAAIAWGNARTARSPFAPSAALPGAGALLCLAAALGSASKAAALLVPGGMLLAALFVAEGRRARVGVLWATAVVGVLTAALGWFGPLGSRVRDFLLAGGGALGGSDRLAVWGVAGKVLGEHPIFGVGFGAFRQVLPRYLPTGETETWNQLHNDWLEVVVDGGGVALVLVTALAFGFARRAWVARREIAEERAERTGLLVGLGAVSIHALLDFGHQIPANALLFVVLAAFTSADVVPPAVRAGNVRSARLTLSLSAAAVFVGLFVLRAAIGITAGAAFAPGLRDAASGRFDRAADQLHRGAVGSNRFDAAWLEGDVRLGLWDRDRDPAALNEAGRAFLRADREVAASAWPLQGLGSFYRRREESDAAARPFDLAWISGSGWRSVGRPGRVAVGLHRLAIEREPHVFVHHDAHFETLLALGLREEALAAIREAGRVQPLLVRHERLGPGSLAPEWVEGFYDGAREALGKTPMLPPERHLLELGKIAYRLERFDEAEAHLRRALEEPADRVSRAEDRYWLGLTQERLGREDEAARHFEAVVDVPNFRESALSRLARLAESGGDLRAASDHLDRLRNEYPERTDYAVRYASVERALGRPEAAVGALRRALLATPGDLDARLALVETLLEAGNAPAARRELDALVGGAADDPRAADLRRRVDGAGGRSAPRP